MSPDERHTLDLLLDQQIKTFEMIGQLFKQIESLETRLLMMDVKHKMSLQFEKTRREMDISYLKTRMDLRATAARLRP